MRVSRSRICTTAILVLFAGGAVGCALVGKIRAKNELNEAAKSYKEGHFDEAQQHAERALSYDPSNKTALIFVARIMHQNTNPEWMPQIISRRPKTRSKPTSACCK